MKRYKVTVILDDKKEGDWSEAFVGMIDRILREECRNNCSTGRPGGYIDVTPLLSKVVEITPTPCSTCNGTGEVFDGD